MTAAQEVWPRCRPWIVEAVAESDFYTIEYIDAGIASGRMTPWVGEFGAVVTEILEYPNGSALNVFGGGGNHHKALNEFVEIFDPLLCQVAKLSGCRWIMVTGREGWRKVGKALGYATAWTVIAKEIS